jgi:hypothetical protein
MFEVTVKTQQCINISILLWQHVSVSLDHLQANIQRYELQPVHIMYCKKKGRAVPLQVWSDPEGSRKLRFPDYVTTAQDGGKFVNLTHRPPLPPYIRQTAAHPTLTRTSCLSTPQQINHLHVETLQ